jgi:hypothetical protein
MLLEDYVDTILESLQRVGRFEVEAEEIWTDATGGWRRAEVTVVRADVPRDRQATLSIEVSWEPTHTFLYQLDDLVSDGEDAAHAVYQALEGRERFCLELIYTVEVADGVGRDGIEQFLTLLDEKGLAGVTEVQLSGPAEGSIRLERPATLRFRSHLHDTAYEDRISFGYFLDNIIANLRHIEECRQLSGV